MELVGIKWTGKDSNDLAQDTGQWRRTLVNTVLKLRFRKILVNTGTDEQLPTSQQVLSSAELFNSTEEVLYRFQ
jgi:hypothetical protein